MTKVVYNACYGGFGLSPAAIDRYAEIKGVTLYPKANKSGFISYYTDPGFQEPFWDRDLERVDPALVQVVEELGELANGDCAKLRIKQLSSGTPYMIEEYDGNETVVTRDNRYWNIA